MQNFIQVNSKIRNVQGWAEIPIGTLPLSYMYSHINTKINSDWRQRIRTCLKLKCLHYSLLPITVSNA